MNKKFSLIFIVFLLNGNTTTKGLFFVHNLVTTQQQQQYRAPDFVQKQTQEFMQTIIPKNKPVSRFLNRCKTAFGCIIVYEGAQEEFFQENPSAPAFATTMFGIHFPANSFSSGFLTNEQLAYLCHEVAHIYYSHAFIFGKRETGSKIWYEHEYKAEEKTIEVLCQSNMQEAAEEYFAGRALHSSISAENNPYIFGVIDSFYKLFKKNPEKIKNKKIRDFIKELIAQNYPTFTWQERYEIFIAKTEKIF